jgi:hypothetical protein
MADGRDTVDWGTGEEQTNKTNRNRTNKEQEATSLIIFED